MFEVPGWLQASTFLAEVDTESANVAVLEVRREEYGCNARKRLPGLLLYMYEPLSGWSGMSS